MNKKENSIILSADQTDALDKLNDFLLTKDTSITLIGYAGTGKTTILQDFVYQLESMRYEFVLCAPTHRAKLVLSQSTNREAITLHKLLSLAPNIEIYNLDYKDLMFHSKGSSQIPHDGIVIIDEASMIDIMLMQSLLKAIKLGTRLIIVGDVDQLPSVGPGNVLKDLIESEYIKVVRLKEIFRISKKNNWFFIYHYVGKDKPWMTKRSDGLLFVKYAKMSPFYKQIFK